MLDIFQDGYLIAGVESEHDNGSEDRRYHSWKNHMKQHIKEFCAKIARNKVTKYYKYYGKIALPQALFTLQRAEKNKSLDQYEC